MQVNTAKHLLPGVPMGTCAQLKAGVNADNSQEITQETRQQSLKYFEHVFEAKLQQCTSLAEVFQLEEAFLYAVKILQENRDNRGRAILQNDALLSASKDRMQYAQLSEKGQVFFSQLLSPKGPDLETLEEACLCKPDALGNRKYSFFKTSSIKMNISVQVWHKIQKLQDIHEAKIQAKLDIAKDNTGLFVIHYLQHPDTPAAIQLFLRRNGKAARVGQIQIEKRDTNAVIFTILDNNRSYVVNGTYGATKLLKVRNFDLTLTRGELQLLGRGYIEDYANKIKQFVINSRQDTRGMSSTKEIQGRIISSDQIRAFKDKVRDQNTPEAWRLEGFVERKMLDKDGRIKTVYVAPYKGDNLHRIGSRGGFAFEAKQMCAEFVDRFASSVVAENARSRTYDVKLRNVLFDHDGVFHVIDTSRKCWTATYRLKKTEDEVHKEKQVLMKNGCSEKDAFGIVLERYQPQLLRDAVCISMLRICAFVKPALSFAEALQIIGMSEVLQSLVAPMGGAAEFSDYVRENEEEFQKAFKALGRRAS